MEKLEQVESFLRNPFFLATDDDGQPRVRVFDSAYSDGQKIYFETTNNKNVYFQLKKNPKIEICCLNDEGMLRVTANAFEEKNEEKSDEIIKAIDKYMANEGFVTVFYIVGAHATITTKSGEIKEFKF